jgi:hypothetical protein
VFGRISFLLADVKNRKIGWVCLANSMYGYAIVDISFGRAVTRNEYLRLMPIIMKCSGHPIKVCCEASSVGGLGWRRGCQKSNSHVLINLALGGQDLTLAGTFS